MISLILEKIGIKGILGSVACVIIMASLGYAVHKFESLVEENARLRATYETALQVNGQLSAQIKENQAALAIRETESARLREEAHRLNTELREVYKNDEKAFNWSVSGIPDGVLECVFQAVVPATDTPGIAPCRIFAGDTGATP